MEHALFGVDLNPNSVRICRLRLWIELLKHAYYRPETGYAELETLPNLDLNVKTGNSLLARFGLDADLSEVFKRGGFTLREYRAASHAYFGSRGRDEKARLLGYFQQLKEQFTAVLHKKDKKREDLRKYRNQRLVLETQAQLIPETPKQAEARTYEMRRLELLANQLDADIKAHEQGALFRDAFEWRFEFPEVLDEAGTFRGFDVVIGNPPYGAVTLKEQRDVFNETYKHQGSQKDLFMFFLERSKALVHADGFLSWIIPNTWLQTVGARAFRTFMTEEFKWNEVLLLPEKVFGAAVVDTHVILLENTSISSLVEDDAIQIKERKANDVQLLRQVSQSSLSLNGDSINLASGNEESDLARRLIKQHPRLDSLCNIYNGIKPYEVGKGTPKQTAQTLIDKPFIKEGEKPGNDWLPLLRGNLIERYRLRWNANSWIKYGPWLAAPRDPTIFQTSEVIFVRQTSDKIIAVLTSGGFIARNNLHIILPKQGQEAVDLKYILGCLNSTVLDKVYTFINPEKGEALAEVKAVHVSQLPIPTATPAEQAAIAALVAQLLAAKATDPAADTRAAEAAVDAAVAALYGVALPAAT